MARTIKTVLISTGAKAGYSYSAWRVVECEDGQRGYKSERGVEILWESRDLYRPLAKRSDSQGYRARQRAAEIADHAKRCLACGLRYDTDAGIVADYLTEHAIAV